MRIPANLNAYSGEGEHRFFMIAAFGNFLVKNGSVSKKMGRLLNRAHEARLMADYTEDSVEMADVKEMLQLRRDLSCNHAKRIHVG